MHEHNPNVIAVSQEAKIGLPKYSNVTVSAYASFEVEAGANAEQRAAVYKDLWDEVNRQLKEQLVHALQEYAPLVS